MREPASHLIRVTMTVPDARPGTPIQFPAWNALYQMRDFVRNVQDLEARCDEQLHALERVDLNTWKSGARRCENLEIRYAVYANEDSAYAAVLNERHSFINFALALFYLPDERERPVRVRFLLPDNWRLATLLSDSTSGGEFEARNYDELVDSPTEAGEFREYRYEQGGVNYRVVVDADSDDYSSKRLLGSLKKITAATTELMVDVPFRRYTFIFHFPPRGFGGMEHGEGTAITMAAPDVADNWGGLEAVSAHEFFHAWNVKRIRPQGLEPVDHVHGNETRDLWFAEGVTTAYQEFILLRVDLLSRETFYDRLALEIQRLQDRPARHTQSAEQAGREAWFEKYPDYLRPARSISYYNKGALLGYLLDLGIRHATGNQRSLDDLMRYLNAEFARRGRFYTAADLEAAVSHVAPEFPELGAFFRDYVRGTEELDYDRFLGYAGLRLTSKLTDRAALGFVAVWLFEGRVEVQSVEKGTPAERAGLKAGDVLLEMDGRALATSPAEYLNWLRPGRKVRFRYRRDGRESTVEFPLGAAPGNIWRIEDLDHATPQQLRVRRGFVNRTTDEGARAGKR